MKNRKGIFLIPAVLTSGITANANGMIDCAREYVFPEINVPVFSVEERNYDQKIPMIDYSIFDLEDFLSRLNAEMSYEEKDNDGKRELRAKGKEKQIQWSVIDSNDDGAIDYAVLIEANYGSEIDFQMYWKDYDYNGTMDEVKIRIQNEEDLNSGWISTEYTYGDYSDIDYDTGTADFTNKNRIQYVQTLTIPQNHPLGEQQFFRDVDGDGKIDWVQVRRFYDVNYDGVNESVKVLDDRDMDGIFEDEFIFDGTIFDDNMPFYY